MRVIVMFDLPTTSSKNIRDYTKFRKFLIKNGFLMLQESIYCKLTLNTTVVDAIIKNIRKNKPPEGLVQVFSMTEKQYSKIEIVVGEISSNVLDTDERLVVL